MPLPRITRGCLTSPAVWTITAITVLYWIAAAYIQPRILIEFLDAVVASVSIAVFIAYSGRFAHGLCQKRASTSDLIIVGISIGWAVQGFERMWRLVSRVWNLPWMIEHHVIGFILAMLAVSGSMHLMVKGAMQGQTVGAGVAPRAWSSIFVALVFGIALGVLATTISRGLGR